MKLLVITQKVDVNDDILGFFHDWILEFAKQVDRLTVICLNLGEYALPDNVKVLSLGKESTNSRLKKFFYVFRFYRHIWRERRNYDAVFVHMNPEYVVLGGWLWKMLGKKISLWYVHKSVDMKLKIAGWLADQIFTAAKESCRLESGKIEIVGHGINIAKYSSPRKKSEGSKSFQVIYAGRISEIKNQKLLVAAVDILVNQDHFTNLKVKLIGGAIFPRDLAYLEELKESVDGKKLDSYIDFTGSVRNSDMPGYYHSADLSVNLCPTGGMDKAVLESIAAGVPVIVYNQAFAGILGNNESFILKTGRPSELAEKIKALLSLPSQARTGMIMPIADRVAQEFSLDKLIKKIIKRLGS